MHLLNFSSKPPVTVLMKLFLLLTWTVPFRNPLELPVTLIFYEVSFPVDNRVHSKVESVRPDWSSTAVALC